MNQLEFSRTKANFLHRRYAIRLGRRYALAAAGFIVLGVLGCPKFNKREQGKKNVNRPFFGAIRDNQTGTVLFMGSIVEPQSN